MFCVIIFQRISSFFCVCNLHLAEQKRIIRTDLRYIFIAYYVRYFLNKLCCLTDNLCKFKNAR